jgi:hypothetical protein
LIEPAAHTRDETRSAPGARIGDPFERLHHTMRQALRPIALPAFPDATAASAARAVAQAGGPAVRAVIFFGSRKTRARPDSHSPWDFFVIVSSYRAFYRSLKGAGALRRHPAVLALLNTVLPPSVIALRTPGESGGPHVPAKCPVISMRHFRRDTSPRRHDHFLLGRLFQPVEVVYAADPQAAADVLDGLARAAVLTYSWGRAALPPTFDAVDYGRTLLRVSFDAEIRPEPARRVDALWQAQESLLRPLLGTLLAELASEGFLTERRPGVYSLARPVSWAGRLGGAVRLRWSLVRATTRWAKHVVTYDDWLDFLVRKVQRHSGRDIVLTPRERRWPLLFLWPRVYRYIRYKDAAGPRP